MRQRVVKVSRIVTVSVMVLGLVATWPNVPAFSSTVPTVGPAIPTSGALFGSYVQSTAGWSLADFEAATLQRETALGRKYDIASHYYSWDAAFPGAIEAWDKTSGRIPMISWRGISPASIVAGNQDTLIRARADAVKNLGTPVFIRWFPQMDLDSVAGPPATFIAAWRHIHDIFVQRGATSVGWVWCPSASGFQTGEAQTFYPGDTYVDWVCAEGYNWAPGRAGSSWLTFASLFSDFYQWAAVRTKPIMIGATGVQERNSGEKANWITMMASTLKSSFPKIKAIVYYDAADTSYDWRTDTSSGASAAYRAMALDPYFNTRAPAATGTVLLGAFVQSDTGWTAEEVKATITDLETRLGRKLDIDSHYYFWNTAFPDWAMTWDVQSGRIPLAIWDGNASTVTQITSGSQDSWIRAQARGVKSLGAPVLLSWIAEMDGRLGTSSSPSAFISAWKRMHDLFAAEGATNARWVWCPSAWGFHTGNAQLWYPGDAYVDWICADGYNWGTPTDGKWRSFAAVFNEFYAWASLRGKPILIGETGTREGLSGQKAQWISDMASALKSTFPGIRAVSYFDAKATARFDGLYYDWRLDTSQTSFNAFKAMGADPYFHGSHAI